MKTSWRQGYCLVCCYLGQYLAYSKAWVNTIEWKYEEFNELISIDSHINSEGWPLGQFIGIWYCLFLSGFFSTHSHSGMVRHGQFALANERWVEVMYVSLGQTIQEPGTLITDIFPLSRVNYYVPNGISSASLDLNFGCHLIDQSLQVTLGGYVVWTKNKQEELGAEIGGLTVTV